MNRNRIILIFGLLLIILHGLWIWQVGPVPSGDGQLRLCRPLKSYLRLSMESNLSHRDCVGLSRESAYPAGYALIGLLAAFFDLQELLLSEIFLVTFLLFIPFLSLFLAFSWRGRDLVYGMAFLAVFPPVQMSLRAFSPHGFVVIFALTGIAFWMRGWFLKSGRFFGVGFFFLWYAAIFKHLGLWLACGFLFVLVFFCILRRERIRQSCLAGFIFLLCCLPWYGFESFRQYFSLVSYYQGLFHVLLCLVMAVFVSGLSLFLVLRLKGGKPFPELFCGGFLLLFCFFLALYLCVNFLQVTVQGLNHITIILIICGYVLLLRLAAVFDLRQENGFWFTLFYVSFLNAGILYYSRFGYNIYVWCFPLCLAALLTVLQTERKLFLLPLWLFFFWISNFFPSFPELRKRDSILVELGTDVNLCVFRDHPLSWRPSELRALNDGLSEKLKEFKFSLADHPLPGFTIGIDGPLSQLLEVFSPSWYMEVPHFVSGMRSLCPEEIFAVLEESSEPETIYRQIIENNELAFILVASPGLSQFESVFEHEKYAKPLNGTKDMKTEYLMHLLWDYLQEDNRLFRYYERFEIGDENTYIHLYLSRMLKFSNESLLKQRLRELKKK